MATASGVSLDTNTKPLEEHHQINAWEQPGPAAYDFRSDTITTPTMSMLKAIQNTTLLDDVYAEDPTTIELETYVAQITGHEAALLVMSGTMGNQVAIRTHLGNPPHSVLCDRRGHVFNYEAGGLSTLSGAMLIPVMPANNHHLTLEDVKNHVVISDDSHACPTRVISLENTLDGEIMPLTEIKRIHDFARQNGITLHLDGARIWEAVVGSNSIPSDTSKTFGTTPSSTTPTASGTTLSDFCSLFDSVSLCLSKGLGAPIGSVLVGSTPFIARARRIRKMFGGGTRQSGIIAGPALVAIQENFGRHPTGQDGKLRSSHANAMRVAELWTSRGGKLAKKVETNMVWLDLKSINMTGVDFIAICKKFGLTAGGGRLVVHYQISDEAIERLTRVMDDILSSTSTVTCTPSSKSATTQIRNGV